MICTNCYKAEYVPAKTTINKIPGILDCMKCPKCGDIIFTHEQSSMIDEKRKHEMDKTEDTSPDSTFEYISDIDLNEIDLDEVLLQCYERYTKPKMTVEEAVALLKTHNRWRRGADIPMTDTRNVGIAIDTVVAHHEAGRDDLK